MILYQIILEELVNYTDLTEVSLRSIDKDSNRIIVLMKKADFSIASEIDSYHIDGDKMRQGVKLQLERLYLYLNRQIDDIKMLDAF